MIKEPKRESLQKLIDASKERESYEDPSLALNFLCNTTVNVLQEKRILYHAECYKNVTNKTMIERLKSKVPVVTIPKESLVVSKENMETFEHRTNLSLIVHYMTKHFVLPVKPKVKNCAK